MALRATVLVSALPLAAGGKCYGIAFSGGGDKGAFEAGVVQGLVARLAPEERQWNVMTGISAGSIIASAGGLYSLGEEEAMADFMVDTVTSFAKRSVYKNWFPGGLLQGVGFETGLYNTRPLFKTLEQQLATRPQGNRNFTLGATDDGTGSMVLFDESMVAGDVARWATYVRASSAIPGLFESVTVDGRVLSDGGCVIGVDVFSAVQRCREVVDSDADIVIDVVTCEGSGLKTWDQNADDKTLQLLLRGLHEQSYNKAMADVLDACLAYPEVNWRYYIEPPASGLPSNGINFDQDQMLEMVRIGNAQAANATLGGACKTAHAHRNSRKFRDRTPAARAPIVV